MGFLQMVYGPPENNAQGVRLFAVLQDLFESAMLRSILMRQQRVMQPCYYCPSRKRKKERKKKKNKVSATKGTAFQQNGKSSQRARSVRSV